jgi:putative RNA 2'-phosphotransferase
MTHPALIERITRSLAYMLRHQPEQFDLELDEFGWADLREVVRALNERLGESVAQDDVQEAVSSGDRQRYEIDRGMIRALYGHSIDVQPGEPSQPPELLYVGVSRQDAERAERFGLRPGRRRFLHLALTSEDALETAARSSEDVVLVKVHALDAWEEGISFYDRKALFLSDPIPTHYLEISEIAEREEPPREHSHEESYAGAHAGESQGRGGGAETSAEEIPAEGEASAGSAAPREYAPRGPGEGGGQRRRGRRGGRGRGRDFSDDRRPPTEPSAPPAPERGPAFQERPDRAAPPARDDRPRDDRPRQGYGRDERPQHGSGGGPRYGGGAPRPAYTGGGQAGQGAPGGRGGYRGEQGGPPRGDRPPDRGGFREDRGRGFQGDRPPRQDPPRAEDRGPAPQREGWQRREERPRQAPPPSGDFGSSREERRPAPTPPPPRVEPPAPPPAPPAPRVEPPKPAPKRVRRESSGEGSFGAGL